MKIQMYSQPTIFCFGFLILIWISSKPTQSYQFPHKMSDHSINKNIFKVNLPRGDLFSKYQYASRIIQNESSKIKHFIERLKTLHASSMRHR